LEASGELAPGGTWASDTGDPIVGYYLSPYPEPMLQIARPVANSSVVLSWVSGAIGMQLQRTSSLATDWLPVMGSTATNQITLATGQGHSFFRLVEP